MDLKPMEENLSEAWGLHNAEKILKKILEGATGEHDTLVDFLQKEKLVVCSYALGKLLASNKVGLRTSQLRRFYHSMLNLKAEISLASQNVNLNENSKIDILSGVLQLKPLLANAGAKQPQQVQPFFLVVNRLLDEVKSNADYQRLCQFVEAVVAYHRYCGGRA